MSDDDAADNDPFDANHLDPYLFVSTIPPLHSLVLNKFTSIKDHVSERSALHLSLTSVCFIRPY